MTTVHGLVRSLHESASNRASLAGPWGPLLWQRWETNGAVCLSVSAHTHVSSLSQWSQTPLCLTPEFMHLLFSQIWENDLPQHSLIVYSRSSRFKPQNKMFSRTFTAFLSLTQNHCMISEVIYIYIYQTLLSKATHGVLHIFVSTCVPRESNPQPLRC